MVLKHCDIVDHLVVDFDNGTALSGKLICKCGCDKFNIHHSGRRTHGFLAPYVIPKNNRLHIRAKCLHCGNEIILVNNQNDFNHLNCLDIKGIKAFNIVCKMNYFPENMKNAKGKYTNNYEELFIYADINGKEVPIFE